MEPRRGPGQLIFASVRGKAFRSFYSTCRTPGRACCGAPVRERCCEKVQAWLPPCCPAGGRVALFSQIRDCASVIETFVRHYAALGFVKLLLYLDDPDDAARQVLEASGWVQAGFVELVAVDEGLKRVWPSLPSWRRVGHFAEMEVQSRQILNNEHALIRARQLGVDWLLHVDSDELLCLPSVAPDFFSRLAQRGCTMYTFTNVEGVPEAADSADVLQSVRIFRQNMGRVPRKPDAGVAFFRWQLRLGGWFISYENGKSAVNVKHAVKCLSVCMWEVSPQLEKGRGKEPDGSTCTWYTNNEHLWNAAVNRRKEGRLAEEEEVPRLDKCESALLLHFCVCDFAAFWRKRWTQLGYLSASDQFRVRATSGAMMARFYRLQCERRQGEALQLFEAMCICTDAKALKNDVSVGILLRADPERPAGPGGPSWPSSPREVPYAQLALECEGRGKHFDAWQLLGKALQGAGASSSPELLLRRARCALAADLAGSAAADAARAVALGEVLAFELLVQALDSLGRRSEALAAAEEGMKRVGTSTQLQDLATKLRTALPAHERNGAENGGGLRLPSPEELQNFVVRAIRPDNKGSRLYVATLAVAMGWWQEVGGDESQFANALARAAIGARKELAALDAAVRPPSMRRIRELWDAREADFKATGAVSLDVDPSTGVWASLGAACQEVLAGRDEVTVPGCHAEGSQLGPAWAVCSGLTAELLRSFNLRELQVLTELRVVHLRSSPRGPEVDNGGLLPDNRREASLRLIVPCLDGPPAADATLVLRTKDRELALTYELKAGRAFCWWSRQTFHQIVGGESFFVIQCWAVIPQRLDRPMGH
eukprot:TRINITY_DN23617_c0_g1_i1.p1 TRINITY_DN23617_c0_g1~~TRINITY_DN23617_c0_g1_i1.p1  ORF type:complete len:828 (-),score=149.61 TRINITY_DN23617_c0_g1_i1:9-2492(-)